MQNQYDRENAKSFRDISKALNSLVEELKKLNAKIAYANRELSNFSKLNETKDEDENV